LNLATWNVQGLRTKRNEVFEQLEHMNIHIGVLSETKKKGQGNEDVANYINLYSGVNKEKRAKAGVSIVVHKRLKNSIKSWENVNERLMQIQAELMGHDVVIVAVYAPSDHAPDNVKEAFEVELTTILNRINSKKEIIIMGDMNSRVGKMKNGNVVGGHGEEVTNNNGERLIQICERFSLKIMNGYYSHKDIHKYSWTQNTRQELVYKMLDVFCHTRKIK
jgi:exonuclease III